MLYEKKRQELVEDCSTRVSFSEDDVMVEDFIEHEGHPYEVYDLKGVLLESNCEEGLFYGLYSKYLPFILECLNEDFDDDEVTI